MFQNCDTNFSLLIYTGDCLFKLDSTQQAEFFFLKAYQIEPKNATVNYNLAVLNYYRDEFNIAEKYIEKAIKYDDSNNDEYYQLASEIQFYKDNYYDPEKLIRKAINIDSNDVYSLVRLSTIFIKQREYLKSIELANKVLNRGNLDTTNIVELLDIKSTALINLGDSAEACKVTDEIFKLNKDFEFSNIFWYCELIQ